ncbi:KRAB-A domain-containing protein 2-like [Palaemon carinicauda]|uniref:KRAB-A domain-containing protein 2-like n=1 Tax=Palaemon carinicauda TaxID=392227 RepID=UPI0035B65531
MQSTTQAQYKWIIVWQCHLTRFVILRPLTSKGVAEVTFQLLDIFILIGAPCILQSDNGSEFAQVVQEMKDLWPHIVHGKPPERHRVKVQSNGRTLDIKDMLAFNSVQNQKNSPYPSGIKRTPYAALLGEDPKVRLTSTSLLQEVIDRLETEDDLAALGAQFPTDPSDEPLKASEPVITPTQPPQSLDEPITIFT